MANSQRKVLEQADNQNSYGVDINTALEINRRLMQTWKNDAAMYEMNYRVHKRCKNKEECAAFQEKLKECETALAELAIIRQELLEAQKAETIDSQEPGS